MGIRIRIGGLAVGSSGSGTWTPLKNGLIGYWKLDEVSGNALDSIIPLGHDGTPYAVTQGVAGKINNGYDFTRGTGNYVSFGLIPGVTVNSVSFWVQRKTIVSGYSMIYCYGTTDYGGLIVFDTGQLKLMSIGGSILGTWSDIFPDKVNLFHIVVVTSVIGASGKVKLYVNGVSYVSEVSCAAEALTRFTLGNRYNAGAFGTAVDFGGVIDEVALYNRALTASEVKMLFDYGLGITYPFKKKSTSDVWMYVRSLGAPLNNAYQLLHSVGDKRIALVNTTVKYSADNGETYSAGINCTGILTVSKGRILASGRIVLFGINKIYYSDDNCGTIHACTVLDGNGDAYVYHNPVNASYPGSYWDFMGGFIENNGVCVLGNYTNSVGGASPVQLYYSLDGVTWKIFYVFGQNTNYRDDGTTDGGTTGNLLGDAGNPLVARHIHAINLGYDGNYYVATGEITGGEAHFLKCAYDSIGDVWNVVDLLNSTSSNWTRMRALGVFERNGYLYWGSDSYETFTVAGTVYDGYGIYKCAVADINDVTKHILLKACTDVHYSFFNIRNIVFAGYQTDLHIKISYDYGENWTEYPIPATFTGSVEWVWFNELYKFFVGQHKYFFEGRLF